MRYSMRSEVPNYDTEQQVRPKTIESPSKRTSRFDDSKKYDNPPEYEIDTPDFIKLLASAVDRNYTVTKYIEGTDLKSKIASIHIPNLPDTISHLKFLRALGELKRKIAGDVKSDYAIKLWQVFVTQAVKRFITFVTACKKYLKVPAIQDNEADVYSSGTKREANHLEFFNSLLPPLDVLMVWHSFLLNPKSCYDSFMRNGFLQFADFPFPLKRINESIDHYTFDYNPQEKLQLRYLDVIRGVTDNTTDLIYSFQKFSMFEQLVSVYCPVCGLILVKDIPYTNDSKTGFADDSFEWNAALSQCECKQTKVITHESLRKRQLMADFRSELAMPGSFKYFSGIIGGIKDNNPILTSGYVKEFGFNTIWRMREESLRSAILTAVTDKHLRGYIRLLLREYLSMNLVHCLVPNSFQVSEDLVGCVMRQERFVEKMNEIDWLHSPVIRESLYESSVRYSRFFKLLTYFDNTRMMVPTLDIDLIWHTHQLSMAYYFKDCLSSRRGAIIDHDDKVEESRIHDGFEWTAREYRKQFKEDYSICFCSYCVSTRVNSKSSLNKIFKMKNSIEKEQHTYRRNPLFKKSLGFTHVSYHNAIALPSRKAEKKRAELDLKFNNKVPWREDTYRSKPSLFVNSPTAPIALTACVFYDQGMCCTVRDVGGESSKCFGDKNATSSFSNSAVRVFL